MAAARRSLAKSLPPARDQPARLRQDEFLAGHATPHCRGPGGAYCSGIRIGAGAVALIGHSLGGAVAFEAAALLAGRVRVLVAFEPILFGHLKAHGPVSAYDEIAGVASRYNELARTGDWNAVGEWFVDYWAAPGTWAAMPNERKQNMFRHAAGGGARMGHGNDRNPLEGWSTITAPVHLIHAADTRTPTREIVKLLAKTYPTWHVHEVPSGGHMAPLARPDLVNPLIAAVPDETIVDISS